MSVFGEILRAVGESGVLDSSTSFRAFQQSLPRPLRQRIRDKIDYWKHQARCPKPEVMFNRMIKAGEVKIIRRRFKCPLVVQVKPRRTSFGARRP